MIFENEKTPFQAISRKSSKSGKKKFFQKGLSQGFGQKLDYFGTILFRQYRPGIFFYAILEQKNALPCYKNKKFKKSKNCHFSKGVNPWFWSKNSHFFQLFF